MLFPYLQRIRYDVSVRVFCIDVCAWQVLDGINITIRNGKDTSVRLVASSQIAASCMEWLCQTVAAVSV